MTAVLHLARHGETVWHAENRYAGSSDVALTERGLEQAAGLARWATAERPHAVHASTLSRAWTTAQPAAEVLGLDVVRHDALREVDFGRGEGLTRAEMAERFPDDLARFLAAPARHPLPGGERGLDAVARAAPVLHDVVAAHADGSVLVVMHSTLLRLVLCTLLGIDPDSYRTRFPRVGNAAVTSLRLAPEGAALLAFNQPT